MKHSLETYPQMHQFMNNVSKQLSEHVILLMEDATEEELKQVEEDNYKKRSKINKKFHDAVKQIEASASEMYDMQIRFRQIGMNLGFVLKNAHNKVSYKAIARYVAEYEFLSKEISKLAKPYKNYDAVNQFLDQATVLNENYFELLVETVKQMQENIIQRMNECPQQYIDLDIAKDSYFDFEEVKSEYKNTLKKLKEDKNK